MNPERTGNLPGLLPQSPPRTPPSANNKHTAVTFRSSHAGEIPGNKDPCVCRIVPAVMFYSWARRTAGLRPEDEWAPSVPRYGLVILFVSPETTVAAAKLWPCSYQRKTAEINSSCVSDSPVTRRSFFAAPLGVPQQADVHLIVVHVLDPKALRERVSIDSVNRMLKPFTPA